MEANHPEIAVTTGFKEFLKHAFEWFEIQIALAVQYGYNPDRMFQVKSYALVVNSKWTFPKTTAGKMMFSIESAQNHLPHTNSPSYLNEYFVRQTQIAKQIK
jgi:hypothetical protein